MPAIVEITELIGKTTDEIIDFVVTDEFLSSEFENFLIKNQIEIKKESELNEILISYLLDGKISDGRRVLDYFISKNPKSDEKTVNSLKESFISVFRINKILKNCFEAKCLISGMEYSLIPLVKMTNLRGIGLFDFIKARAVEINGNFYLLEIFEIISQYKEHLANLEVLNSIIKNPKIAVMNNREKFLEIKNSIASFNSSFLECFKGGEIVVSNREIDKLLGDFYLFHTGEIEKVDFSPLKDEFNFEFFEIPEFQNDLIQNALTGFGEGEKEYDAGLYSDPDFGIFILPFLGTFNKILKENSLEKIKGAKDCVKNFITSGKVPPGVLRKKAEEFGDFVEIVNKALEKDFKTVDEIIDFYKEDYKDGFKLSSINILYNSKIFSKVLGYKEEASNLKVGRNDPCPCGSGKKYKKCCLNK